VIGNTDRQRENDRNKTSGEFGAKTQTAPGIDIVTPAQARIAELDRVFMRKEEEIYLLNKAQFWRRQEILSAIIHDAGLVGVPHTLVVADESESGEEFWMPARILDADGKELWNPPANDDLYDSLSEYTTGFSVLGSGYLHLENGDTPYGDSVHGFELNPAVKD
jgi:hypothetical protein